MISYTVKNIPPELYEKLRKSAAMNRRSINNEIIVCIERSMENRAVDSEALLSNARKLRSHTANHPITDRELTRIKGLGRA